MDPPKEPQHAETNPLPLPRQDPTSATEARRPLTSLYDPYIAPSDTCLQDARKRLKTALQQVHHLRTAFSERVYEKYRVRLHPPDPVTRVLADLEKDPASYQAALAARMGQMHRDKQSEKRGEPYRLAGLHLIILPEGSLEIHDKSISQAAATAGQQILERTRILRNPSSAPPPPPLPIVAPPPPVVVTAPARPSPSKISRPSSNLLSLQPHADGPGAATAALVAHARWTRPRGKPSPRSDHALPALPSARERLARPPVAFSSDPPPMLSAVPQILRAFVDENDQPTAITKIDLLHRLKKLETDVDPVLTFCVLHSVGLMGRVGKVSTELELPEIEDMPKLELQCGLTESILKRPMNDVAIPSTPVVGDDATATVPVTTTNDSGVPSTQTTAVTGSKLQEKKADAAEASEEPPAKKARLDEPRQASDGGTIESLRGGGGILTEKTEASEDEKKETRSSSAPAAAARPPAGAQGHPDMTMAGAYAMNQQILAQTAAAQSSMAALARHNAGLVYSRDQAAMLRGYQPPPMAIPGMIHQQQGMMSRGPFPMAMNQMPGTMPVHVYPGVTRVPSGDNSIDSRSRKSSPSRKKNARSRSASAASSTGSVATKESRAEKTPKVKESESQPNGSGPLDDDRKPAASTTPSVHRQSTQEYSEAPSNKPRRKDAPKGLKFVTPVRSQILPEDIANTILAGRLHQAVGKLADAATMHAAFEYHAAIAANVPIPKTQILIPLKERMTSPNLKNPAAVASMLPRDPIVSSIVVWLWATHEDTFQDAFAQSGRLDVDADCKWLIQAAVDTAFRETSLDMSNGIARGEGPFAKLAAAQKAAVIEKDSTEAKPDSKMDVLMKEIELHVAMVASRALMIELRLDTTRDIVVGNFDAVVGRLDEARVMALKAKTRERVLLANMISRHLTMSESFSHAYVSAMVRAGEAFGHSKLFEMVHDDEKGISSLMPYDNFTNESNGWEDPCRPDNDFSDGITPDELIRRAHARAMIQKSLRKLQERHNIRGGVPSFGPYTEMPSSGTAVSPRATLPDTVQLAPVSSPRTSLKRRQSSMSEPPILPGTGSAAARYLSDYEPRHYSAPFDWNSEELENAPYGSRSSSERARSVSLSLASRSGDGKKKARRSLSLSAPPLHGSEPEADKSGLQRSTLEIDWGDVAGIFQKVELPRKAPPKSESQQPGNAQIFAPFCRKFEGTLPSDWIDESDDGEDEDLREETILASHQVVLDEMKAKLSAYLEARNQKQEKRKKK